MPAISVRSLSLIAFLVLWTPFHQQAAGQNVKTGAKGAQSNVAKPNARFSNKQLSAILTSNPSFTNVELKSVKGAYMQSGKTKVMYSGICRADTEINVNGIIDSSTYFDEERIYYEVNIKGIAIVDSAGKILSGSRDTVSDIYRSGCGFKDDDYVHFDRKARIRAFGMDINSIQYNCDTIFLYDRPFGRVTGTIEELKGTIVSDYSAETESAAYHNKFIHIWKKNGKAGYWLKPYVVVKTHEYSEKTGAYTSWHYNVRLVSGGQRK